MLALFAVAVIAVLGSAITIRHVSNQLTRGLTQLVPGRSVTEAREDLTDVPDPRDSVFVTETTAPPTTAAPKATTAAPTTTQPPTTAASARIRNDGYRLPLNGTKVSKDYSPTIPVKSKRF